MKEAEITRYNKHQQPENQQQGQPPEQPDW